MLQTAKRPKMTDLTIGSFLILRNSFFGKGAKPRPFRLRDKRNTQDDPLDEYIHKLLSDHLPTDVDCPKAPGPLITPDLVVLRPEACKGAARVTLSSNLTHIVAKFAFMIRPGLRWTFAGFIFSYARRLFVINQVNISYRHWFCVTVTSLMKTLITTLLTTLA